MIKYVIIDVENQSRWLLNNISPESSWKGSPITIDEANGNNIFTGDSSQLKIVSYDFRNYNRLHAYMKAGTKAKVTVVGDKYSLVWNDYITFLVSKKIRNKVGTRNTIAVLFQMKEGHHNIIFSNTNPSAQKPLEIEGSGSKRLLTLSGNVFSTLNRNPFYVR